MRKSIVVSMVLMIGISFLCAAVSSAQDKDGDSIFKYKQELSITDKQETNLRNILSKLQDYITKKTTELNNVRVELNKMITDKAALPMIKSKLQKRCWRKPAQRLFCP